MFWLAWQLLGVLIAVVVVVVVGAIAWDVVRYVGFGKLLLLAVGLAGAALLLWLLPWQK